jgi:hypothetical protein
MLFVLLRYLSRNPWALIIGLSLVIILALIFEKNPRVKETDKK